MSSLLFFYFTKSPYNVENCTFLASTLYAIHRRFLDYGNSEPGSRSKEAEKLESVIERFGRIVCQRLEKMILCLFNKQKVSPKSQPFVNYMKSGFYDSKSPSDAQILLTRFQDWSPVHRKGFLLSPELEYSKAKMNLVRKQRSNSVETRGPRQTRH